MTFPSLSTQVISITGSSGGAVGTGGTSLIHGTSLSIIAHHQTSLPSPFFIIGPSTSKLCCFSPHHLSIVSSTTREHVRVDVGRIESGIGNLIIPGLRSCIHSRHY